MLLQQFDDGVRPSLGFRVEGSEFRVWGLGFRGVCRKAGSDGSVGGPTEVLRSLTTLFAILGRLSGWYGAAAQSSAKATEDY